MKDILYSIRGTKVALYKLSVYLLDGEVWLGDGDECFRVERYGTAASLGASVTVAIERITRITADADGVRIEIAAL
jgi:hypothetical protein